MNYRYTWRGVTILIVDATEAQAKVIGQVLVKHLPNDQPALPPPTPTHRICVKCWNQINLKKGNYTFREGGYQHVKCPPLRGYDP